MTQALNLLKKWCEIDSRSHNKSGLEKMANALEKTFRGLNPDHCEQIQLENGPALLLQKNVEKKPLIFFSGHMDTVLEPFEIEEEKGRLHACGAADMKGGLVVLRHVLQEMHQEFGWKALVVPDEELGSPHSSALTQRLAQECDLAIVFEPSLPDGSFVSARKGSRNFKALAKGVAAHVGRDPEKGVSAIAKLVRFLHKIHLPGVHVGKIEGGFAINQVPESAVALVNIRSFDNDQLEKELQRAAQEEKVELTRLSDRPAKPFDAKTQELFALLKKCDPGVQWKETGGVCDGNNIAAIGVPTIDTFGVLGDGLHTKEEYMVIESLEKRIQLCMEFLRKVVDGYRNR